MVDAKYTTAARRAFVVRRVHALSGILPLGVFLVVHLGILATALRGEGAFRAAVGKLQAIPLLGAVEVAGIFVPLAFHSVTGLWLFGWGARGERPRSPRNQTELAARDPLKVAQRWSGILALVFIGAHLWEYRVQTWLYGMRSEAFHDALAAHLSSTVSGAPVVALAYLAGLAATVFHFASGLATFCSSSGITASPSARRRAGYAFAALGVGLFLVGADTIVFFATGSRAAFR